MNLRSIFLPTAALLLGATIGATVVAAQPDTSSNERRRIDTTEPSDPGRPTSLPAVTGARPWYDTLEVTRPRYIRVTNTERLALAVFTAVTIPAGLVLGATTIVPPSVTLLWEGTDAPRAGFAFSTGYGFGGDTNEFAFFPDARLQFEMAYYFVRSPQPIVRVAMLVDQPIASIHPRDFFWLGVAGGAGVATDFKSIAPYGEAWLGLMNPMGIRFLTLFPMHNYGIRARAGYNLTTRLPWYELSLCATSTFW